MAEITGKSWGSGVAEGRTVVQRPFVLLSPESGAANGAILRAEVARWRDTAARYLQLAMGRRLGWDLPRRATFTADALAVLTMNVELGICCALVAQAPDGRVLGGTVYFVGGPGEGTIALQAIDPTELPGAPGAGQFRGIGTALIAAVSRDLLARGVTTLSLHPLDEAADAFWRRRGFAWCGTGGRLCVRGREAIEALRGRCEVVIVGEEQHVLCGRLESVAVVREAVGV